MKSTSKWILGLVCLIGIAFLASTMSPAAADDKVSRKLTRKINVMERVLDEVLHDSPNLLIHSDRPTNGIHLDGFGVLFTFKASLAHKSHSFSSGLGFIKDLRDWRINTNDDRVVIHYNDDDDYHYEYDSDDDEDDEYDDEDEEEYYEDVKKWRARRKNSEKRLYEKGREELIETLIDYGDSMPGVDDNEWVCIAAFLSGDDFFKDNDCSHLVIKAKIRDLKAGLSEEEMKELIVVEEY